MNVMTEKIDRCCIYQTVTTTAVENVVVRACMRVPSQHPERRARDRVREYVDTNKRAARSW